MRIAMVGIRGVPANYSGLETCAEEVGARLVERGHEVIVFCRRASYDDHSEMYRGMRRITLAGARSKFADTLWHSAKAMTHLPRLRPDAVLAFNPAIALLCAPPRLLGIPFCLNPDGFDWRRPKWPPLGRAFIHASAWAAGLIVDQLTIDSPIVRDHYASRFPHRRAPRYIPNGANIEPPRPADEAEESAILAHYGLKPNGYILFLSRHVADNSCREIIAAYEGLDTDVPLFFGGGGHYGDPYAEALKATRDGRIRFPGPIYEEDHVRALHHHCRFVVHGNQPGGTSLGLLKALGYGACVMTLNTPDNTYAVKDAAARYELDPGSIRAVMRRLLDNPGAVENYRTLAVERIREEYLWDDVAAQYEEALVSVARKGHSR